MLFSEIYSAYYQTVAAILTKAVDHPLSEAELLQTVKEYGFAESVLTIPDALWQGRWQLLLPDGSTPIKHMPTMPLTILQKRWLKAIAGDPRIRLFGEPDWEPDDVDPLFLPEDFAAFDRYTNGDSYEDADYREHFQMILHAIREHAPLSIQMKNRWGEPKVITFLPEYLEYSEKDDKFRVVGTGEWVRQTLNLGRILRCTLSEKGPDSKLGLKKSQDPGKQRRSKRRRHAASAGPVQERKLVFELYDERNGLERILMHFAHFQKEVEKLEQNRYQVTLFYDEQDETELLIRVLSFGPMIRVLSPQEFIVLIQRRLREQKKYSPR